MTKYDKIVCKYIINAISESFEEIGYLDLKGLESYIKEIIRIEICDVYKEKYYDYIYNKFLKNKRYREFLDGNTYHCSHCKLKKPISSFNSWSYNGQKRPKTICKKCSQKLIDKAGEKAALYKKYQEHKQCIAKEASVKNKIQRHMGRDLTSEEINQIKFLVRVKKMTPYSIYKVYSL
ncbi:hypothetical protein [Clostridioides difficile]|uniref:hypothetical protein n=1 Tax=Clostridioides difficile TaxID=1496 RepID=UPI0010330AD2|nr:hypothetical protein [Clostridioides difficile]MDM9944118.1 hypothetical protein [Clostridioides difficile]